MPEKSGARTAAAGIKFFLLGQFYAAAVDQPDQGDVQSGGEIGASENIFSLAGEPGAGENLVVEADDDRPFSRYFVEAVNDIIGSFNVIGRIEQGVQGALGPLVNQVVEALLHGELTAGIDFFSRQPGIFYLFDGLGHPGFHLLKLADVGFRALELPGFQFLAKFLHLFKIGSHFFLHV